MCCVNRCSCSSCTSHVALTTSDVTDAYTWRHTCADERRGAIIWTGVTRMLTRVSIHALTTTIYLLSTLHKFTATQWQNLFIAIVYIVSVAQFHRIGYIDDISEFNVFSFFSWISHSLTQFSFGCRHLVSAVMMFAGGDHQTRVFMQRELRFFLWQQLIKAMMWLPYIHTGTG